MARSRRTPRTPIIPRPPPGRAVQVFEAPASLRIEWRRRLFLNLAPLAIALTVFQAGRDESAIRARSFANTRLETARKIASDPEVVRAVVVKNEVGESEAEIRRKDAEWQRNRAFPLRKELTASGCAERLRQLVQGDPYIVEAFLMDKRGSLVCSTVETSDYWQGDEPKWQKTFLQGQYVFVDSPALDYSTNTFAIQLSMVLLEGPRKIGALTLTLKIPRASLTASPPSR